MLRRRLVSLALCAACHHSPAKSGGPPTAGAIPSRDCYGDAPVDAEIAGVPGVRASWFNAPAGNERWYVLEAGAESQKPPLVLIHGVGELGTHDFYPVLDQLSRSRRVLAVDLPGFGRSNPRDRDFGPARLAASVDTVVRTCAPGRIDVLGHSSGGALAILFAAKHHDIVRRLVVVDVAGILRPEVLLPGQLHQTLTPLREDAPALAKAVEKVGGAMFHAIEVLVPSAQAVADTGLLGQSPAVLAATALLDFNFGPAIQGVRAPTLVLWGARDHVVPPRIAHLLDERIADSELEFIPDAGHVPMNDEPARMAAMVAAYLDRPPQKPPPAAARRPQRALQDGACKRQDDVTLSGEFAQIVIEGCKRFRLHHVRAQRVSVRDSEGRIDQSSITQGLVVDAARLTMTGGSVTGNVAIDVSESLLDIAGVAISGAQAGIRARTKSELILSVTPIESRQTHAVVHQELELEADHAL